MTERGARVDPLRRQRPALRRRRGSRSESRAPCRARSPSTTTPSTSNGCPSTRAASRELAGGDELSTSTFCATHPAERVLRRARLRLGGSRANAVARSSSRSGSASSTRTARPRGAAACGSGRRAPSRSRGRTCPSSTRRSSAHDAVAVRDDVERVDLRAPHGHLHLHPAPREPVGTLTADLHRRHGRDRQLDLAAEALEPLLELVRAGGVVPFEDLSLRIAGRGRRREVDLRDVALVEPDEAWRQLGRPAGQQDEQAGRERVERAGVARARAGAPPQLGDHFERRRPRRLVDEDDPRGLKRARRQRGPRR